MNEIYCVHIMFDCDAQPELSEIPMRIGLPKSIVELFGKRSNQP